MMTSIFLSLLLPLLHLGLAGGQQQQAVTLLVSLLNQSSLCPNENMAIFSCTVGSNNLEWAITGLPQQFILPFNRNSSPGKRRFAKSGQIAAHLLSNSTGKQSVLLIKRLNSTNSINITCNNHTISYYPSSRVPERPTSLQPNHITRTSQGTSERDFIGVSWLPPPNMPAGDIHFYKVWLENGNMVSVRDTSAILVGGARDTHIVHLKAVDHCGQESETLTKHIKSPVTEDPSSAGSVFLNTTNASKGQHKHHFTMCTLLLSAVTILLTHIVSHILF